MTNRFLRFVRGRWHPLWRLRQSSAYRWFQRKFDPTLFISIPETGIRVALKLLRDANWIVNPGDREPEIRAAFKLVLDVMKPSVFWDVGANIGFYSWLVRRHPSIRQVVMFEPDPVNHGLICSTIQENRLMQCKVIKAAVAECDGTSTFLVDHASGATGSLASSSQIESSGSLHDAYKIKETIQCETVSIDGLVAGGLEPPGLIKIDVEGAEDLVVAGGSGCLAIHRPALIVETSNKDLVNSLVKVGYRAFQIDAFDVLFIPNRPGFDFTPFENVFKQPTHQPTAALSQSSALNPGDR